MGQHVGVVGGAVQLLPQTQPDRAVSPALDAADRALANAKLGAVHGFAAPLGGMYNSPHGALCAALLPAVIAINQKVLNLNMYL